MVLLGDSEGCGFTPLMVDLEKNVAMQGNRDIDLRSG